MINTYMIPGSHPYEKGLSDAANFSSLDEVPTGIAIFDATGQQTYVNPAFCAMVGWKPHELAAQIPPFKYWPSTEMENISAAFKKTLAGEAPAEGFELRFQRSSGELFDVNMIIRPIDRGTRLGTFWIASVTDISTQKRTERHLFMQYAVSRIISESPTVASASTNILQAICESLQFDVGALWQVDPEVGLLRCIELWHLPSVQIPEFGSATRSICFNKGTGLPGRVWESGAPFWIVDIVSDPNFPRTPFATREGIRSGFAFPVTIAGHVIGIMEFFTRVRRPEEPELLPLMANVGAQIGQFMERKNAEHALLKSEQAFRLSEARKTAILESALDCIVTMDSEGKIIDFNPAAQHTFGYSHAEAINQPLNELIIPPHLRPAHQKGLKRFLTEGTSGIIGRRIEMPAVGANGREFPVELTITVTRPEGQPPFFTGYLRDISERKQAEEKLKQQIKEKEVLMSEIHHRVKNNLQVVLSLINLQSADPAYRNLLKETKNRIRAMSLIHEKMYQSPQLSQLDLQTYFADLAKSLLTSYGAHQKGIVLSVECERIDLPMEKTVPLSLLVNEILSNSLKHAFPDDLHEPQVSIRGKAENGRIELTIADNGIGLPDSIDLNASATLGLRLISMLAEQIDATIDVERRHGTQFRIEFQA
jgi:PAS domain S-box-containing protein